MTIFIKNPRNNNDNDILQKNKTIRSVLIRIITRNVFYISDRLHNLPEFVWTSVCSDVSMMKCVCVYVSLATVRLSGDDRITLT